MTNFKTGAVRDTGGKGRMDLLPMCALLRVSKHMEDALTHYPERNWEMGLPMHSMLDSAMRHLAKYMDGQMDEDHLCAAATNLLMAMWTEEKKPEMQDIQARNGTVGLRINNDVSNDTSNSVATVDWVPQRLDNRKCKYSVFSGCDGDSNYKCTGTKEMDYCPYDGVWSRCKNGKP